MSKAFANSGEPDQTPRFAASDLGLHCLQKNAASDLGLHCLPVASLGVSRLQWVKCILLTNRFRLTTANNNVDRCYPRKFDGHNKSTFIITRIYLCEIYYSSMYVIFIILSRE